MVKYVLSLLFYFSRLQTAVLSASLELDDLQPAFTFLPVRILCLGSIGMNSNFDAFLASDSYEERFTEAYSFHQFSQLLSSSEVFSLSHSFSRTERGNGRRREGVIGFSEMMNHLTGQEQARIRKILKFLT